MEEIEAKILNINKEKTEKKIVSLGGKKVFEGEITAYFFDFPSKKLTKKKQILRLRKKGEKSFLTFKNPIKEKSVKSNWEYEIEISNLEETKKILEFLGLKEILKTKKKRTSYCLDNVLIEFDKYKEAFSFVPELMEIEAENKEEIYRYAKLLGFEKEDCKPWTLEEIVREYKTILSKKTKNKYGDKEFGFGNKT